MALSLEDIYWEKREQKLVDYVKAENFDRIRKLLDELRVHRDLGHTRLFELTLIKIYQLAGINP